MSRVSVVVPLLIETIPSAPVPNRRLELLAAFATRLSLPDWHEGVDLCLRAAGTLPDIHTQSWDIALTSDGPTIIEVNFGGDLNLHQLAHKKGLLQEEYLDHLRANGIKI